MWTRTISLFILFQVFKGTTQELIQHKPEVWFGYVTETRINEHFSIWNDAHLVPTDFLILRTGLSFKAPSLPFQPKFTAGYAHVWAYIDTAPKGYVNENRPWCQIVLNHHIKTIGLMHRFRYDARFKDNLGRSANESNKVFNSRWRYMLQLKYCFPRVKNSWQSYIYLNDEILLNSGKNIENSFRTDQNRLSGGVGLKYKNTAIQVGYMHRFKHSAHSLGGTIFETGTLMIYQIL